MLLKETKTKNQRIDYPKGSGLYGRLKVLTNRKQISQLINSEDLIYIFVGITFLATAISWISFARISMSRIEKEIEKDGLPRPGSWDGLGARAIWYCHAMILPLGRWNHPDNPLFDVMTARKYAKPLDKALAILLMISASSFVAVIFIGMFVLDLW